MKPKRRPGRPRKMAARKPCGRLRPEPDPGPTAQALAAKRALMRGMDHLPQTPLGALRAHGLITDAQLEAGTRLAMLRRAGGYGGPARYATLDLTGCRTGGIHDPDPEAAAIYGEAMHAARMVGPTAPGRLYDVAIEERLPLYAWHASPRARQQFLELYNALEAVAAVLKRCMPKRKESACHP